MRAVTTPEPDASENTERLLATVREVASELHPHLAGRVAVHLDSVLDRELGLDSLSRMELWARLEQRFGPRISEQALIAAETPRELLRALGSGSDAPPDRSVGATRELSRDAVVAVPSAARTLVEALEWHAGAHPDRTHVELCTAGGKPRPLSYAGLYAGALAVAGGLRGAGLEPGGSVAIMLPTGFEYLRAFVGTILAGGIPVPIYPPARASQIEDHLRRHGRILDNAGAALLVSFDAARPAARLLRSLSRGIRGVVDIAELERGETLSEPVRPAPADIAFLQYTSGSTGSPKGVVLTHADLLASLRAMGAALEAGPDDVFVSWLRNLKVMLRLLMAKL